MRMIKALLVLVSNLFKSSLKICTLLILFLQLYYSRIYMLHAVLLLLIVLGKNNK